MYLIDCNSRTCQRGGNLAATLTQLGPRLALSQGRGTGNTDNGRDIYTLNNPLPTIGTGDFTVVFFWENQTALTDSFHYIAGTNLTYFAFPARHSSISNNFGCLLGAGTFTDSGFSGSGVGKHAAVVRRKSGQLRFWVDGRVSSDTASTTSVGQITKLVVNSFRDDTSAGLGTGRIVYLYGIELRAWGDTEAQEFVDNPWSIFRPQIRPIFYTAGSGPTYTLTASAGLFSLTGVASSLVASRLLTASTGSFVLTGQDAGLRAGRVLAANVGTFVLDGKNINLKFDRVMSAGTGTFTLTGNVANLVYSPLTGPTYTLTAEKGTFTVDGQTAQLLANRVLSAQVGEFDLVGNDTGLYVVVPGTGPVLYIDLISKNIMLLQRLD